MKQFYAPRSIRRNVCFMMLLMTSVRCNHSARAVNENRKPNVILILADDAGYADFGFMGSRDILTPNLDAVARDGTVFTDAHVSASVCSPSRAGLLTGKYQQRFGHECNLEPKQLGAFDDNQTTIAEFLKSKGYHTSIFGKWHLGEEAHQHPLANGFDYFWGFLAGGRSYFPNDRQDRPGNHRALLENYTASSFTGYLTDEIGKNASDYIDSRSEADAPFFMYVSFNAPHTPMEAKPEAIAKFGNDHSRPVYAAMMWSMDEAIGRIIQTLKDQGEYENTLIFFLSDNGGAHNNGSSVVPFKGWKGNQYEGGTRVPMIVTWSKTLPSDNRFDGLSSSLDIFSTVTSVVGNDDTDLDGVSLIPYLAGEASDKDPHQELFWRKDEMASIRMGNYKYIVLQDSVHVLYDLGSDLDEVNDLAYLSPPIMDSLRSKLDNWQKKLMEPLWKEPEDWNAVTRTIYQDLMANRPPMIKDPKALLEHNGMVFRTKKDSLLMKPTE